MKSGNLVRLRSVIKSEYYADLLIEIRGANILSFAYLQNPYKRLCFSQNGSISFKDSLSDKSTMFYRESFSDPTSNTCTLKCCYNQFYLVFNTNGYLTALSPSHCLDNQNMQSVLMTMEVIIENPFNVSPNGNSITDYSSSSSSSSSSGSSTTSKSTNCPLRPWEIERFINEGYLHLPQIISSLKIKECRKVLNYSLGKPGAIIPGGTQLDMGKFEGGITNHVCIRELLTPALHCVLDYLLGQTGAVDMSNLHTQIAFRFPELNGSTYIDDSDWHTDGYRQDKAHPFSLLLGICLSDVCEEYSGNLIVWPGSHSLIHQCKVGLLGAIDTIKLSSTILSLYDDDDDDDDDGDEDIDKDRQCPKITNEYTLGESSSSSPSSSSPAVIPSSSSSSSSLRTIKSKLPKLPNHYQLKAKAGDVVILHPDTAHTGGVNLSDDIRQMVYFRIRHTTASLLKLNLFYLTPVNNNNDNDNNKSNNDNSSNNSNNDNNNKNNSNSSSSNNNDNNNHNNSNNNNDNNSSDNISHNNSSISNNNNNHNNHSNRNTNNINHNPKVNNPGPQTTNKENEEEGVVDNKAISTYEELALLHSQDMWIDIPGVLRNMRHCQRMMMMMTGI